MSHTINQANQMGREYKQLERKKIYQIEKFSKLRFSVRKKGVNLTCFMQLFVGSVVCSIVCLQCFGLYIHRFLNMLNMFVSVGILSCCHSHFHISKYAVHLTSLKLFFLVNFVCYISGFFIIAP